MAELLKNKLDDKLFERFCQLPVLSFHKLIRPDNDYLEEQKQAFFATDKTPVFSYSKAAKFNVQNYFNEIDRCASDIRLIDAPDWIRDLYLAKLDGSKLRAEIIRVIQQGDDAQVAQLHSRLYPQACILLSALSAEFEELIASTHTLHKHRKPITAKEFATAVQEIFYHYGMTRWRIKLFDGSSIRISRGRKARHPIVHIPKKYRASKARARRALIHEIEVHALRTHNGIQSPLHILQLGLDGYMATEEGLAMHYQCKQGKRCRKFNPGFWEAYACALSQMNAFHDVFRILLEARQRLDMAMKRKTSEKKQKIRVWNLCVRTYRGITYPEKPGLGTCKDAMYRTGLAQIQSLDFDNISIERQLFCGNIGIQHMNAIKHLDLSYAQVPQLISEQMFRKNRNKKPSFQN